LHLERLADEEAVHLILDLTLGDVLDGCKTALDAAVSLQALHDLLADLSVVFVLCGVVEIPVIAHMWP
jgi:hypothetical protein